MFEGVAWKVGLYLNVWGECNGPMSGCRLVSSVKKIVMVVSELVATIWAHFMVFWPLSCEKNVRSMSFQ